MATEKKAAISVKSRQFTVLDWVRQNFWLFVFFVFLHGVFRVQVIALIGVIILIIWKIKTLPDTTKRQIKLRFDSLSFMLWSSDSSTQMEANRQYRKLMEEADTQKPHWSQIPTIFTFLIMFAFSLVLF